MKLCTYEESVSVSRNMSSKRMLPDKCDQFASTLAHGDGLVS